MMGNANNHHSPALNLQDSAVMKMKSANQNSAKERWNTKSVLELQKMPTVPTLMSAILVFTAH
jgi:hypothetical protein